MVSVRCSASGWRAITLGEIFHKVSNLIEETMQVEWFCNVAICAHRFYLLFRVNIGADNNNRNRRNESTVVQFFSKSRAIHTRHHEIQQDEIRVGLFEDLQRGQA